MVEREGATNGPVMLVAIFLFSSLSYCAHFFWYDLCSSSILSLVIFIYVTLFCFMLYFC